MPKRSVYPWRSLTSQLFIFFILPLTVLLLMVTFGGLRLHQQAMRVLVAERDERAVRAAAQTLDEQFQQRLVALRSLAVILSSYGELPQLVQTRELVSEFDAGIAKYSSAGELESHVGGADFWDDPARQDQIANLLIGGKQPEIQLAAASPEDASPILLVIEALGNKGGFVVGAFSADQLIESALNEVFTPGNPGLAYVVDANRQVFYRTGPVIETQGLLDHPGVDEALLGTSGAKFLSTPEREHVVAYSPIETMHWALLIEEPWEMVASPLLRITEFAPLVLIPLIVLAVLTLWYVSTRIVQPLIRLEKKASELAWGDFEAIEGPVGGVEEVRRLQDTLIHLAHKISAAQNAMRGYIGAITRGQEDERRRLARELHDDTLQALIALNQRVQFARLEQVAASDQTLAEIQGLTESTIQDLRRFTRALRPIYLEDLGLMTALDMLVRENAQISGIQMTFQRSGEERRLLPEIELALYRITQEALSNTAKHSYASKAEVSLEFLPDAVRLAITDDGRGFEVPESPAEFAPHGHFGLLGMHERADLIGASLEIESGPALGTSIQIFVPGES